MGFWFNLWSSFNGAQSKENQKIYQEMTHYITGLDFIIKDENEHEQMHIDEIDEQD